MNILDCEFQLWMDGWMRRYDIDGNY